MIRVMQRRLLAVLLSIPLAAMGATGAVLHVCQSMGGIAGGGCDCEKQAHHQSHEEHGHHAAHAAPSTPKLEAQPCCTVDTSDATGFAANHEALSSQIDDATFVVAALARAAVPSSRFVCDVDLLRERAPPNIHGPPLFIRHCSLLN